MLVTTEQSVQSKLTEPKAGDFAKATHTRTVFDAQLAKTVTASVYERELLAPGQRIAGPAVVVEEGTSTLISSGFNAIVDTALALILTRKESSS